VCSNADPDKGFVSSFNTPDRLSGSSTLVFRGHKGSFVGAKRPECEVNHSPLSSAQVKKCLHGADREEFALNF
jgi:hypothetical protein